MLHVGTDRPGRLSPGRRQFSQSSGSLASRSSTLSSLAGWAGTASQTTSPPAAQTAAMVTIRCERLNSEKQVEEVEIDIPASVYSNIQTRQAEEFQRNNTKRNSLASKLKHLILR